MRTTIEISDKHRGILLSLAAQKGLRGYSSIIQEALDFYIDRETRSAKTKREVLEMKGSWGKKETEEVKHKLAELRKNWKQL